MVATGNGTGTGRASEVSARLAADGVSAVAGTYVDTVGIARVKAFPVERLEAAVTEGIGMSPVFDAFLLDDSITRGRFAGGPMGDLRLFPDLDRVVSLSAQPGWAWAPVDRYTQQGERHPNCSRGFARRMLDDLTAAGLRVLAAFEIEWYVDAGTGDELVAATTAPAYGAARIVELSDYCRDVLDALARQGTAVQQLHPEYAVGQFEVSVAAEDPLAAADTSVLVRQTIRAVSARHGLRVSFAPSVVAGGVGNGGHVHLSLWRDGRNVTGSHAGLSSEGQAFAAGLLDGLPALLAIGAPSVASYLRLVPQRWAGAYRCWGVENREAAIRVVLGSNPNIEIKCIDLSANPYLLIGALLASGLDGVERQARLPEPVPVDPAWLDDAERAERGIERLPDNLADVVAAFEGSKVLTSALGEPLADTVATVRRAEIELFAGATPEEIVTATRWRH